jgi:hypothetical protein
MVKMSIFRLNAILPPSGEKLGSKSFELDDPLVRGVWPVPSGLITEIPLKVVAPSTCEKAIICPSGENDGSEALSRLGPGNVSWVWPEPSEFMIQIWGADPGTWRSKAILSPSGENVGWRSRFEAPLVTWVWPLPSGFITQIWASDEPTGSRWKAIHSPSAEYDGARS